MQLFTVLGFIEVTSKYITRSTCNTRHEAAEYVNLNAYGTGMLTVIVTSFMLHNIYGSILTI